MHSEENGKNRLVGWVAAGSLHGRPFRRLTEVQQMGVGRGAAVGVPPRVQIHLASHHTRGGGKKEGEEERRKDEEGPEKSVVEKKTEGISGSRRFGMRYLLFTCLGV